MTKKSKLIYIVGSLILGVAFLLLLSVILIVGGVFNADDDSLIFASDTAEFIYDDEVHESTGWKLINGKLKEGHVAEVTVSGSQKNAGSSENYIFVTIKDQNGVDVSKDYKIKTQAGTLTVKPRPITITADSAKKEYDGTPLNRESYLITSSYSPALMGGHSAEVEIKGTQTEIGESVNALTSVRIIDANGVNQTSNYKITIKNGTLTVTVQGKIIITSGSAQKKYDGKPLVCDKYDAESTLPEGYDITYKCTGTITEVGETDNTYEITVTKDGKDYSKFVNIEAEWGKLVITERNSSASSGDLNTDGNLSGGMLKEDDGEDADIVALKVNSGASGKIYLRLLSYGDYNGSGWNSAQEYNKLLDNAYSLNYLNGIALNAAGFKSVPVQIEVYGNNYLLPYYMAMNGGDYQVQTSDVSYSGSTQEIYSLNYFLFDYIADGAFTPYLAKYTAAEREYRDFIYSNYLNVNSSTLEYLQQIISENGFNKNDKDIAAKVARYIQSAATYNLKYDRSLDYEDDIVVSFLSTYKQGICQHYASAATLLFRALGIPARYTIGYVGQTKAGEWVEITAMNAHAWVEIYVDGFGWVQIEVTGSGPNGGAGGGTGTNDNQSGNQGNQKDELNVKPVTEYMLYDGESTLTHSGTLQGLSELISKGYRYVAQVEGSQKEVGKGKCEITSLKIYDPNGNDVTANYKINFSSGILHVYLKEITVQTTGATKIYDGTPLTNGGYKLLDSLLKGHSYKIKTAGLQTNVGKSINTYQISITESGEDVTYMYKVNSDFGILEVKPREITVTAQSAQKTYDGAPLENGGFTITSQYSNALCQNHTAKVTVYGKQTEVGASENIVYEVVITDKNGNDVTSNYKITKINGLLTVTE